MITSEDVTCNRLYAGVHFIVRRHTSLRLLRPLSQEAYLDPFPLSSVASAFALAWIYTNRPRVPLNESVVNEPTVYLSLHLWRADHCHSVNGSLRIAAYELKSGCPRRIRTSILAFRERCPTIGRSGNMAAGLGFEPRTSRFKDGRVTDYSTPQLRRIKELKKRPGPLRLGSLRSSPPCVS